MINNFNYSRRYKAEVSAGIGYFANCIDILTKLSVMTNCLIIFFTSTKFKAHYTKDGKDSETDWTLT